MAKVFVIGATGETGIRLCQQLVARRHEVLGLHRKPEQYSRSNSMASSLSWVVTRSSS
ncbi:hypothetical protein ALQ15_200063 [Pseudomonas syringae pv. actinidiae]|uniref:NAD(P)-binding domain-containing protein n=1 Tax=Pseudomonas syringae pv. actinidiae TaxID=103796 RepID=A0A7Z6UBJ8_PSESF|nr:hypothetical protein ALQ15_200063 [Pseudomonas syringae pv. actinidiae]